MREPKIQIGRHELLNLTDRVLGASMIFAAWNHVWPAIALLWAIKASLHVFHVLMPCDED
jgi:hypothetical protein